MQKISKPVLFAFIILVWKKIFTAYLNYLFRSPFNTCCFTEIFFSTHIVWHYTWVWVVIKMPNKAILYI